MAEKTLCGPPPPSLSSAFHLNKTTREAAPKSSPNAHYNGSPEPGSGSCSSPPHPVPTSRIPAFISHIRTLRSLMSPEGSSSSTRPPGSDLNSTISATGDRNREEPDALLDLILESQGQRLNDQRASLSLLPDPGPSALCGTCSHGEMPLPSLDFYYMLIHYQSDRMEDQRCSLPDLDDVIGSVPEGQEEFFSLIQRVQSRRIDEQRALLLVTDADGDDKAHAAGSSPLNHCCHH